MAVSLPQSAASYGFEGLSKCLPLVFAGALAGLVIIRYVLSHAKRRKAFADNGCAAPPQFVGRDPIFGLDFVLENVRTFRQHTYLDTLVKRYKSLGNTYGVRVFHRRGILTCEPENVKAILSTQFKDYSLGNRTPIMGPLLGRGIFVSDGEQWSHSRAMLRPNFVKNQLADLTMLEAHLRQLLALIPRDGAPIDLQELFLRFTIDSATEFLFGHSTHTLTQGTARDQQFGEAFKVALDDMALQFRLGPWRSLRRADPAALAAYRTCRAYVDNFVDDAMVIRKHGSDGMVGADDRSFFLKELAKATEDKEKIRDELLNILIAGRDTTASLLSSAFHVLSRRPDVWKKIRDEVSLLEGKIPVYEELRNMKYIKMAIRDTVLPRGGGPNGDMPIFIPKGCTIIYTVYAMHRRTDLFGPDAAEFRPERWESQRFSWEYLPFNGGPRICLGQQYALTEALYVIIRFAQEFETIKTTDPSPWIESLTLTVASANGVEASLNRANA
ncbi:Cytochrome P450 52A12 [Beauveria bassiana]|nr:Cytochrome P450 52A12 [Beauveria bassiana]KAH8708334.1 Cytochrome P450 monooxygenase fsdH [Beauveria bassiana]